MLRTICSGDWTLGVCVGGGGWDGFKVAQPHACQAQLHVTLRKVLRTYRSRA